jgi:protein SCO1/2
MSRFMIIALLWVSAIAGCRAPPGGGAPESSATALQPASPGDAAIAPRSDRSIYALSMNLTDQDGRSVGLDVFRGKPVFIGMFYGTCPSACPLLISTIRRAMSELDASTDAEVRVLLVSFDPERDSPQALRAIVSQRGLDERWKLASAPDDQVRELAALLGIQYRRLPDGSFSHTSSVVLLDRAGAIDMRIDDTSQSIEPLVERARALAAHGSSGKRREGQEGRR